MQITVGRPVVDIEVIGLDDRLAFLTDGTMVPITHMFDEDGEETDDPDEAFSFLAGEGQTRIAGLVDDFEPLVKQ